MSGEKDELIKAQNEVIGVLFEIIKRFQTNNDLTDEYLKLSIKEQAEIDNERLENITKEPVSCTHLTLPTIYSV